MDDIDYAQGRGLRKVGRNSVDQHLWHHIDGGKCELRVSIGVGMVEGTLC